MRIGSLFSGYGGLSMATEAVFGGSLAWVSDIEAYDKKGALVGNAPLILAHRFPGVPNLGDITKVDWSQVEPVDIIDGGSPCQDVSTAGKRAGMTEGTRSNLWVAMRDAIAHLKPAIVIWENVRGVTSARADSAMESDPRLLGDHPSGEPALRALGRVLGDLADLGFDAEWEGLPASIIGAPHGRFRIFVVAAHPERLARLERRLAAAGQTPPWRALGAAPRRDRALAEVIGVGLLPTPKTTDAHSSSPADMGRKDPGLRAVTRLLPTPTATPYGNNQSGSDSSAVRPSLNSIDTLLPTPRATDGTKGGPGQRGSSGDLMLPSAVALIPTPSVADSQGGHARRGGKRGEELLLKGLAQEGHLDHFGPYAQAIARWEQITGLSAPSPTKPGRSGNPKLNPEFASFMMGLPPGWVTDVPGLTDNQALHAIGNGVVPLQAIAAIRECLRRITLWDTEAAA